MPPNLQQLESAVQTASVIRLELPLLPLSGDGLVFPPTYDKGEIVLRRGFVRALNADGTEGPAGERQIVSLSSVQSEANRAEMAIQAASRRGEIVYPALDLHIETASGCEQYSVLELSHRLYDAAWRSALVDGLPFPATPVGQSLQDARPERATALFTHAPLMLLLGGWDSHRGGGPLVAKIPRLITTEIIGLDAEKSSVPAIRFDPMDIRKAAGPGYESADPALPFVLDKDKAPKKAKEFTPAELGFGNVLSKGRPAVCITEARQTSVLSVTGLRRLRFPDAAGQCRPERDLAGQVAIAALGLYTLSAQLQLGFNLRSGCELVPLREPRFEVIGRTLQDRHWLDLDHAAALTLLQAARAAAEAQGLAWRQQPIRALANPEMTELVRRSREMGVQAEGD
ncbi:type I-G CRISPR-associated RAMP protein Csb1/Cas7g [Parachitinimonas caeni]|uniref:Type I-U CRISPR-associated RAMP protein Csb1/Cas7u n=1 Tax=Parachitinimonas caeni TaxID=3031301 RepID=A0ABT7E3D8_9NEIS|nr:type I-U CRISPR-associated RAMP protein Csb1/Cas7u [Parachitinimonas caeni]MDK2125920.1 type I-U CRISPR-associated RAMP protein Csb1/Cas7u [Parachitinimonas caeni]